MNQPLNKPVALVPNKGKPMSNLKSFWSWYCQTACIVGIPVLMVIMLIATFKTIFTLTCLTAGYRCEGALGTQEAMSVYMSELVGGKASFEVKPQ